MYITIVSKYDNILTIQGPTGLILLLIILLKTSNYNYE
jgi:hypothetical protein